MKNNEQTRQVKKDAKQLKVWFGGGSRYYYLFPDEIQEMNKIKTEKDAEDFCKNLK